jgi:hypothetical protein
MDKHTIKPEVEVNTDTILQEEIETYILTLNEKEKQVMEIARSHLQSSFCIERSVGFVKWKQSKK